MTISSRCRLVGLLEQQHLDAPGTVIERHQHARAALLHLVDEPRHGDLTTAAEAPGLEPGDRTVADQVADAVSHEARQAGLEAPERMSGQIQAERLALAGEAHRLAPLGQRGRACRGRRAGALGGRGTTEQIVLPGLARPCALVAEVHGGAEPLHERGAVGAEASRGSPSAAALPAPAG